jgi:riboflavin kinase/FMN adenylyltransferase
MIVLSWGDLLKRREPLDRPVRMTIGVFDGLHIGHRKLIEKIVRGHGGIPLVATFRESPATVLAPAAFPGMLMTWQQKLDGLDSLGIGVVVAIDFSEEMSNLSGKAFIGLLKENLTIEKIVVGHNFRFGKSRNAGTDVLKEMLSDTGTEVQVTEPVLWGESIVSSSRIRTTIKDAEFTEAKAMLASAYGLDLRGIPAFPQRNGRVHIARSALTQVLPRQGVYTVACVRSSGPRPGELTVGDDSLTLTVVEGNDIEAIYFE